jgi:hypothetical protein
MRPVEAEDLEELLVKELGWGSASNLAAPPGHVWRVDVVGGPTFFCLKFQSTAPNIEIRTALLSAYVLLGVREETLVQTWDPARMLCCSRPVAPVVIIAPFAARLVEEPVWWGREAGSIDMVYDESRGRLVVRPGGAR